MKVKILLFFLLLSVSIFLWTRLKKDTVYIHPGPSWKKLFNQQGNGFYNLVHIGKEKGFKVREKRCVKKLRNAKTVIFFDHLKENRPYIKQYHSILWTWEPPSVLPENFDLSYHSLFEKIYTWDDDLVDHVRYFKFHYPQDDLTFRKSSISFSDKKLCTLINAYHESTHPNELYSERIKAICFFEQNALKNFDLYGYRWDPKQFPSYKGTVPDKSILHHYRFAICYENICHINGYITEKIFDVMRYGCVPIYWGAENVTQYIPENCFIDRRKFSSYEALYEHLLEMKEAEYQKYLVNIERFLQSEKAALFSQKHFMKTLETLFDEQ